MAPRSAAAPVLCGARPGRASDSRGGMSAMSSSSPVETYRQLLRQARLLVTAERESGVIDAPAAAAESDPSPPSLPSLPVPATEAPHASALPLVPSQRLGTAHAPDRAAPPPVTREVLDAFGDLPARLR